MRKNLKRVNLLIMLLLLTGFSRSQTDIFLDLQLTNASAQIFQVGDFDFTNSGLSVDYFILQLDNRAPEGSPTCRFRLEMEVKLDETIIARGESEDFDLPPQSFNIITSSQLSVGAAMIAEQPVRLNFDNSNIFFDELDVLRDHVLSTGKLPTGTYIFDLKLVRRGSTDSRCDNIPDETDDQPDNNRLVITNPTTLELLFPGGAIGESAIVEITTTFPYFQWFSDANPTSVTYNLSVFEKFPNDQTVQDVLSHPAILQLEGHNQTFFQYPTETNPMLESGFFVGPVRLLEAGKIYYWLVQAVIPTATGNITLTSDVFRFKVADLAQSENLAPQILAFLQQVLGPNYEAILQQLLEEGFEPNGNISFEGTSMDVNDLFQMLNKFLQGEMQLQGVEVY